jgi:histone acetyltransferase
MDQRVESNYYKTLESFISDFEKIIANCKKFNDPKTVYVRCAVKLDQFFKSRLKSVDEYRKMQANK